MDQKSRVRGSWPTLRFAGTLPLLLVMSCHHAGAQEIRRWKDKAPGFRRARTDEELSPLYRDNLEPDFATFTAAQPVVGTRLTTTDLCKAVRANTTPRPPAHMVIIVVQNNTFYGFPVTQHQPVLSKRRMQSMLKEVKRISLANVTFPDSAFILNLWDAPRCTAGSMRRKLCPVPIFSIIKQWDWAARKSPETDVLLPVFNHVYEDIIKFPWEQKYNKALMRAAMQSGMTMNCTRMVIRRLSRTDEGRPLLDAGITNNQDGGFRVPETRSIPIPQHSRWRFLLSPDGVTASCRFGKLLQINSVVVKEASPWIEYFYRSAKPHVHYVPFTRDNVLEVVRGLNSTNDTQLQELATAGQHFAFTYLSQHAKVMYVRRALQMYNALFDDLAVWVSGLSPGTLADYQAFRQALNKRCA